MRYFKATTEGLKTFETFGSFFGSFFRVFRTIFHIELEAISFLNRLSVVLIGHPLAHTSLFESLSPQYKSPKQLPETGTKRLRVVCTTDHDRLRSQIPVFRSRPIALWSFT